MAINYQVLVENQKLGIFENLVDNLQLVIHQLRGEILGHCICIGLDAVYTELFCYFWSGDDFVIGLTSLTASPKIIQQSIFRRAALSGCSVSCDAYRNVVHFR